MTASTAGSLRIQALRVTGERDTGWQAGMKRCHPAVRTVALGAARTLHHIAAGHIDWPTRVVVVRTDVPVAVPPADLVFVRAGCIVHVGQNLDSPVGAPLRIHYSAAVGSWVCRAVVGHGRRDSEAGARACGKRGLSAVGRSKRVCGRMRLVASPGAYAELLDATAPTAGRMLGVRSRCSLLSGLHSSSRNFGSAERQIC